MYRCGGESRKRRDIQHVGMVLRSVMIGVRFPGVAVRTGKRRGSACRHGGEIRGGLGLGVKGWW